MSTIPPADSAALPGSGSETGSPAGAPRPNPRPLLYLAYGGRIPRMVRRRFGASRSVITYDNLDGMVPELIEPAAQFGQVRHKRAPFEVLLDAYAIQLYKPGSGGLRLIHSLAPGWLRSVPCKWHFSKRGSQKRTRLLGGDCLVSWDPPWGHPGRKRPSLFEELAVGLTRVGWDVDLYGHRLTGVDPQPLGNTPRTVWTSTVYLETGAPFTGLVGEDRRNMEGSSMFRSDYGVPPAEVLPRSKRTRQRGDS